MSGALSLAFGLQFQDLAEREGLLKVDRAFLQNLKQTDSDLAARLETARANPDELEAKAESTLLIDLAPHLENFLATLFGIEKEVGAQKAKQAALAPLFEAKRLFVQRRAARALKPEEAANLSAATITEALVPHMGASFEADELRFATQVMGWLKDEAAHAAELTAAATYAAWALYAPEGRARHGKGILFQQPHKIEPENLVKLDGSSQDGFRFDGPRRRFRDGFALTDQGMDLAQALDQMNYCIWCHAQGKDSCSKGLREKAKPGEVAPFKKSVFGITLAGCPLEEKISEMHQVKAEGHSLSALAMIAVDNPTCAMTGHRICNDCMKACIYQKQEPVDIPQAETRILKDVLALPYGFEIYALLTRWNPLHLRRPLPLPPTGRKVLVVGLGPAGATLAYHLLQEGHTVVAFDGLKIEPLPPHLSGIDANGNHVGFAPVRDLSELTENLGERAMAGFGGVAEYGITVRWDKNFLKIVRLLLERRQGFLMAGGVRFGGTVTLDDAWALGFDHVALCMGAGKPTLLDMPNGLARGVRTASDFLMALQLTGAAKADTIANMQLRLPVVVIGGGLTAIDTATESLAYYPIQVEKYLSRYEQLVAEKGEAAVRAGLNAEETEIADEFIAHARAFRAERAAAKAEGRDPNFVALMEGWGGVTLAYRRRLIDSPSYTLNHEEVAKAFEEGITFLECMSPEKVETDGAGAASGIWLKPQIRAEDGGWSSGSVSRLLPARTILVAAGTQPNTVLAREDEDHFIVDGKYFRALGEDGAKVSPERVSKPQKIEIIVERAADGRAVSTFGDLHPSFAGNVVKAMGGAKQGYPLVSKLVNARAPASPLEREEFFAIINDGFRARVHAVNRLTPTIVEVVVHAPRAARAFKPGQFFRLQNYETGAIRAGDTVLAMEGLAMTGAWTDPEQGLIAAIALEMGGSSDLCAYLKPGEPVIMMGPTGAPTHIPAGETVMLAGGGLGNAVLFSIGAALRAAGSKVIYFAGYKKIIDRYKVAEIEKAADAIVWCSDEAPGFTASRPQDKSFTGNIVAAMVAYGKGELGGFDPALALGEVDRVIAIGSDRMMAAVGGALKSGPLAPLMPKAKIAIGSINSPMQCMMKEICAQCIQAHVDPQTGERSYVFSCFNQDQDLDRVDWACLNDRLKQNSVQEKLTAQWIDRGLRQAGLRGKAAE